MLFLIIYLTCGLTFTLTKIIEGVWEEDFTIGEFIVWSVIGPLYIIYELINMLREKLGG